MIVLDGTIVNIALPHIQTDLGFSNASLSWVVNAYALALGSLLLLGGRLGDLLGRRRMFIVGVLLFAGASLVGGLAVNEAMLHRLPDRPGRRRRDRLTRAPSPSSPRPSRPARNATAPWACTRRCPVSVRPSASSSAAP